MGSPHEAAITRLAAAFRDIARQRMQGLPLINESLEVEAVGFSEWDGRLLGVLIAPWFMNVIILPGANDDWHTLKTGEKQKWKLPSGEYEFMVGRLEPVTVYQSCVLFSSVVDFPDQQTARMVAQAVMTEILDSSVRHGDQRPTQFNKQLGENVSRRELFRRTLGR